MIEKSSLPIKSSLIIEDEGGPFLLLNRVNPESQEQKILQETGVSKEFLNEKRNPRTSKVIPGKGEVGKVRLAFSILGSLKVDIGQLVCVKKFIWIGNEKILRKNPKFQS